MTDDRYDRQTRLFGHEGQEKIRNARILQIGLGGLGMPLLQQLIYLGVTTWTNADGDVVTTSSLNRLVGAQPGDVDTPKVAIAERLIRSVHPDADVTSIQHHLPHNDIAQAIQSATIVIGAFDQELPRLITTDLCSNAGVPYVDVATEVITTPTGLVPGGRVVIAGTGEGCLDCLDLLDRVEMAREQMPPALREVHDRQYGVHRDELAGSGPSVVTLNSVVASLAAHEIMCLLTGLRPPQRQLTFRGDQGTVLRNPSRGRPDCPFCTRWRAAGLPLAS